MALALSEEELQSLGRKIWEQGKQRWFYDYEIFLMLSIPNTLGIPILRSLDVVPKDGDTFLFYVPSDIKDDDYDWKRKTPKEDKTEKSVERKRKESKRRQEGKAMGTLRESHDYIFINQENKIRAIYIKTASNEFFKRRIYKLDNRPELCYYQLSHYRNDQSDLIAANKDNFVDPKVGYLVYTYLIRPDLFVKDLLTLPPNYAPTIGWQIPASAISPNLSRSQLTTTDPEVDEK